MKPPCVPSEKADAATRLKRIMEELRADKAKFSSVTEFTDAVIKDYEKDDLTIEDVPAGGTSAHNGVVLTAASEPIL
jgi:hypothetical protein